MTSEKLFLDSDVLLDLFFDRKPFSQFSQKLFDFDLQKSLTLCTSSLVTANLHYIISRHRDKQYAKECLTILLRYVKILPIEADAIEFGLTYQFEDFEDGIQFHAAKKYHCTKFLTRNLKHYKSSTIPVFTAEQYFKAN
jgi:predicted nucleic acid-binding protein